MEIRYVSLENEQSAAQSGDPIDKTQITLVPKVGATDDPDSHSFSVQADHELTQAELDVYRETGLYQSVDYAHSLQVLESDLDVSASLDPQAAASTYTGTPNDTNFNYQWGLKSSTGGSKLTEVWPTLGSATAPWGTVKLAVMDTAISDQIDNSGGYISMGCDFGSGTSSGVTCTDTDTSFSDVATNKKAGHGVNVANIAGATPNNGTLFAGAGYDTPVVGYKLTNSSGNMGDSQFINSLQYIYNYHNNVSSSAYNVKVINMSLGFDCGVNVPDVGTKITNLVNSGITVVAAAGNSGGGTTYSPACAANQTMYPASYSNVVSVGAIGQGGTCTSAGSVAPAYFTQHNAGLTVAASGYFVNTVVNNDTHALYTNCGLGTSYASPIVASGIALMYRFKPDLTPAQVMTVLQTTAVDVTGSFTAAYSTQTGTTTINLAAGFDQWTGYGVFNAKAAVDAVTPITDPIGSCSGTPGTKNSEIWEISTAQHLQNLTCLINASSSNSALEPYRSASYKLMNDITLPSSAWTPIGQAGYALMGATFDGNGHSISGLTINTSAATTDQGLFGFVSSGTVIKNLGLKGVSITVGSTSGSGVYVGSLIGISSGADVQNCYTAGSITASGSKVVAVGGIVGSFTGLSKNLKTSYSRVNVSSTANYTTGSSNGTPVGGLVGILDSGATVTDTYSVGAVSSAKIAGGLVGSADGGSFIKNSAAVGGSVIGQSGFIARILGDDPVQSGGATKTNNYGYDNMSDTTLVPASLGPQAAGSWVNYITGADGANISACGIASIDCSGISTTTATWNNVFTTGLTSFSISEGHLPGVRSAGTSTDVTGQNNTLPTSVQEDLPEPETPIVCGAHEHPNLEGTACVQDDPPICSTTQHLVDWVCVNNSVTSINVTPGTTSLTLGTAPTTSVSATVNPTNAANKNITWSSSNTSVATVSPTGSSPATITARAVGLTVIKATAVDGSGIIGTVTITVSAAPTCASNQVGTYPNCGNLTTLYRAAKLNGAGYFYTMSYPEFLTVSQFGMRPEGAAYKVSATPLPGLTPVYRAAHLTNGGYFYTMSYSEYLSTPSFGYRLEGVAFYASASQIAGTTAVYRSAKYQGGYFYTTSYPEYLTVHNFGMRPEGFAWYAW
jgi:hypothetical protein